MATHEFPSYHWIYWIGPIAGTILAVLLFKLVKALEYETISHDAERDSLIVHVDQTRDPIIAPLSSVATSPARKPSIKNTQTLQITREAPSSKEDKNDGKKDTKEEKPVLPECYAD
jgi:aquaporin rerated protein, other eukaryote